MKVGYISKFSNLTNTEILEEIENNIQTDGKTLFISVVDYDLFMKGVFSKEIRESIKRADLIVPQGKLMNWAVKLVRKKLIEKNPGESLLMQLIKKHEKTDKSFFFIGASRDVMNECVIRLKKSFPNISIRGQFPKEILRLREKDVREVIRKTCPDFILVGLGSGKDEKWIRKNIKHFQRGLCLGIKDGILISAGAKPQPALWIKDRGWQPFVRLLKNPFRVFGIFKLLLFYAIVLKNKIFRR